LPALSFLTALVTLLRLRDMGVSGVLTWLKLPG
jgi:hypothetical protein